jgi:uncharacterized protein YqeY
MTFNYKKYSLEKLDEWVHDAMTAGEATPQEIYDVITNAVKENYYTYKHQASQAYELLTLLNSNTKQSYEDVLKYYETTQCDRDDPSEECKKSWTSFWEENYYPEEYKGSTVSSVQYTDEELEAMCDAAEKQEKKKWVLPVEMDGPSGEYFVTFPDELLEAANLEEGDEVEWVDNEDGSYTLRKPGLMWHPV